MTDIFKMIIDSGVAVGMIIYFIYRDSKFIDRITRELNDLNHGVKNLNKRLDKFSEM